MIILFFAVFVVSSLAGIITSKRKEQTVVVPKESEERRRLLAQKDDLTEQLNMLKKENENAERFKQIVINLRDNFPVLSTGTTFPTNNEALMNFLKERLVSKPGYKINEDNFNRFVNENNKSLKSYDMMLRLKQHINNLQVVTSDTPVNDGNIRQFENFIKIAARCFDCIETYDKDVSKININKGLMDYERKYLNNMIVRNIITEGDAIRQSEQILLGDGLSPIQYRVFHQMLSMHNLGNANVIFSGYKMS